VSSDRFARWALILVLIFGIVWVGDRLVRDLLLTADEPRTVTPRGDLADIEKQTIAIFENAAPSVVYIFTEVPMSTIFGGRTLQRGAGSGFVWDGAGHVVTNHHVVEGAQKVSVRLEEGEVVRANVVGTAADYDIAVLRMENPRSAYSPIPVGSSEDLQVGQLVYAIGNPFGLARTLTTGVISALDRRLPTETQREIRGVIQTDAAINPGNSGGPLLDSAGRLIGVNTAIISGTGASAGIGFAVPVDIVNEVVPQLIAEGKVPRPGLGIIPAPEELSARIGVDGVVVMEVISGSAAAEAGLRGINRRAGTLGDVILEVDGTRVQNVADLARELEEVGIGNTATLTVLRGNSRQTVDVRVMDIS